MEYCSVCGRELNKENKYMKNLCWDCKFGGAEEYEEQFKESTENYEENHNNKDWTGNSKSTFVTLGASNHSDKEREINDFYATDPNALELFLKRIENDDFKLHNKIWECACGMGHLSEVLKKHGYDVISTDLVNRGYGDKFIDFLQVDGTNKKWDILTNPPYKYAKEFVEHSLDIQADGYYTVMFLKIQFLESQARKELFEKYPPKYVYVNSTRQLCAMNGSFDKYGKGTGTAICYCWFVWEKGFNGEPIIRWI